MKKRILVILLAIVLVLSMGALLACKGKETLANKAKDLINDMYGERSEITAESYEMPAQVYVDGEVVSITWTTDNTKVTVDAISGTTAKVLIHITEPTSEAPAGYDYKLTATLKDAKGNTDTISFNRKVPTLNIMTWAQYAAAAKNDTVTVEGVVSAILSKKNTKTGTNCIYLQDDDGGYYVYNMTSDPADLGIEVGHTVRVIGTKDLYSGTYQIVSASVKILNNGAKTEVKATDYTEIFKAAGSDMKNAALVAKQGLLVTIKGVTLIAQSADDVSGGYYRFSLGEGESYIRISGTTNALSQADIDAFSEKHIAGYTADVTGLVTQYNGVFYLIPASVNALDKVDEPTLDTDEDKVAFDKNALVINDNIIKKVGDSIELPAAGKYSTITWALKEDLSVGSIADGKYSVVGILPPARTTVTLVATIKCGNETDTKEIAVIVSKYSEDVDGVIELNVDSLDLASGSYTSKDPKAITVNGLELAYIGLGNYGNGIQWRTNATTGTSTIYNTKAADKDIVSITFTANGSVPDGSYKADNLKLEYGATDALGSEKTVSLTKGKDVVVTFDAGVKYFKISHNNQGAVYLDAITITLQGAATPDYAAKIGGTGYKSFATALASARTNDTIVLLKDVTVTAEIRVTKKITLDLNGKTISNTEDIYSKTGCSVIAVYGEGELTITGNGKVFAKNGDCYALSVFEGGKLTVENGEFLGNVDCVYAYEGHVVINGGKFDIQQLSSNPKGGYTFLLNLEDASGAAKTATITVKGGSFVNFDPSHSDSEAPQANFVAEKYQVKSKTEDGKTVYTVVPKPDHAGTEADPYSVADVELVTPEEGYTEVVYVTGIIVAGAQAAKPTAGTTDVIFYIADTATGEGIQIYKGTLASGVANLGLGDTVVVKGTLTRYKGAAQLAKASGDSGITPEVVTIKSRADGTIKAATTNTNSTVTFTEPAAVDGVVTAKNGTTVKFTVAAAQGYKVASVKVDGVKLVADEGVYSAIVCGNVEIVVNAIGENMEIDNVVIEEYAKANNWSNGTKYVTVSAEHSEIEVKDGGNNSGKYYTSGQNWRIYQNESPSLTITAKTGYKIVSVKITYAVGNTGTLVNGTTKVASDTVITVDGNTLTLTVGNTGTATNGNVQISEIEIIYAPVTAE